MFLQPIQHEIKDFGLFQLVVDLVIEAIPDLEGGFLTGFFGKFLLALTK